MAKLSFLPYAISMSAIEEGGENPEEPIEFGVDDPGIANAGQEESLLFILRMLPKDRHRVIALMLFLTQLGYEFRYEDIGSVWGMSKVAIHGHIARMQKTLKRAGIGATKGRRVR